ncbi:MAG TPA: class I SAM-dependent methyltransferase [Chitinophagaceae bacterium]
MNPEEHILQSWRTNAAPWAKAIRTQSIESRKLVTNKAIVDVILELRPQTMLDVGCGEGWLCRTMAAHKISAWGIDAIPELINSANEQGHANFSVCSYQEIVQGKFKSTQLFDVIVFNFSLFGNELVESMLLQLRTNFSAKGKLIIQTLHPHSASADQPYADGWRTGSWNGFSEEFTDPAPWYFRTLESWVELLSRTNYKLHQLREPVHPHTQRPASLILVGDPIH